MVGIVTTGPAYKLDVTGTGRFTNGIITKNIYSANSDINITAYNHAINLNADQNM